ncbi:MAG: amino acid permease [Polyangiaceae bacterium]|nr:amino acid permease [Polyangiaceae bacterium]
MSGSATDQATEASRPLGLVHVAAVVVGAIIGVGIFFTPASLARALPSPAWVLGIWLLGGVVSVAGAFVFAELGGRFPHAGGLYVFLREGFGRAGPFVAFLYGWLQLLVVQPGSMAIIAIVLVDHVEYLTGTLPHALKMACAVLVTAVFTAANLLGLRTGGRIQIVMAGMKIGALALLVLVGLVWGETARLTAPRSTAVEGGPLTWMVLGLIPVLFSFGGAYHGTYIAGSVRDPHRSVPRGIVLGILIVLIGYLGVNVAFLRLLGHDGLAASKSPAAEAAALALGPAAGNVLAVVIVLSAAGILNTVCLGFPFVIFAMARDRLFFERAGKLDPKTDRPSFAVAIQGLLACIAILVGASRVDVLLKGITFADALFQGSIAIVHLRLRSTPASADLAVRAPALFAWTFLVLEMGLAIGSLVRAPVESAYGAGVLVLGVFAWRWWRRER